MTASTHTVGWLVVAVFLVTASVFFAAPAAAQQAPDETNATATPDQDTTELYAQLYDLDIHSVEFDTTDQDGHVAIIEATWNGPTPQRVTVTQFPDGGDVAIHNTRLLPDERTKFTVDLVDDSAAALYTEQSLEQGRAKKLTDDDDYLITGPWSATEAQITGAAGLLAGLLSTSVLAYRKVASDNDEPERIL
ncbi:hypothetical protein SAMN05216226_106101 [Halovenus aranensis]|uniref:Uncharacterized protein n=1 Tax=Halovenus aranensis TaxID=890420 RepID=A0A1G8VAX2_9EURY|nr:hypothetical protein [Halovenus aranensis]SDJ63044.1 hypothetical protein SAMN05216226_106101 [Halovenus aranensis]